MLSDEWLSRYGLLENFNASVTRTGTRTGTGTGTWTTGVTAIALCTSCSRAKNIIKCLDMNGPGPNVFLYILRADVRFDSEDVDALKAMADVFGEEIFRYMIIVFTRGNQLKSSDRSVDDKLKEMPKEFQELYQKCHGRYVTIENPGPEQNGMEYIAKDRQRQRDISNLVETIYQLLCDNNWTYYSNGKGTGMKREE